MKELDLTKSVYELTGEYPDLIEVLKEIGFIGIANPVVRNTLGRKTTIAQGCKLQMKNIDEVTKILREKGFAVRGI